MTMEQDKKYDGFSRYHLKLFNNYFELQKHLKDFWYINKLKYIVFEETHLKREYSLCDVKKDDRI